MPARPGQFAAASQWVLAFGATAVLQQPQLIATIRNDYPAAYIFGCSTAGEICGTEVSDDSLVLTAVHFSNTPGFAVLRPAWPISQTAFRPASGWVDLSQMATEVVMQLQARDPGRQVAVNIEPALVAKGDAGLMRVVMENLLGNAWAEAEPGKGATFFFTPFDTYPMARQPPLVTGATPGSAWNGPLPG